MAGPFRWCLLMLLLAQHRSVRVVAERRGTLFFGASKSDSVVHDPDRRLPRSKNAGTASNIRVHGVGHKDTNKDRHDSVKLASRSNTNRKQKKDPKSDDLMIMKRKGQHRHPHHYMERHPFGSGCFLHDY